MASIPGVILWSIDESNGGDAIFLSKDRKSFDDVRGTDKVCFSTGTPSEHLWDFASLVFTRLGDNLPQDNGVVAKDCWDKLKAGKVQVAVLWQPFTAIAQKAGYPKVFATGGQADDVIIDVLVANREYVVKNQATLSKLAQAYFKTIDSYVKDPKAHATFITEDCGPDCAGDPTLGTRRARGHRLPDLRGERVPLGGPLRLSGQDDRSREQDGPAPGRQRQAQGRPTRRAPSRSSTIRFLRELKRQMDEQAKLAAEVAGEKTPGHRAEARRQGQPVRLRRRKHEGQHQRRRRHPEPAERLLRRGARPISTRTRRAWSRASAKSSGASPRYACAFTATPTRPATPPPTRTLSDRRAKSIVQHLKKWDAEAFPDSRFDVQGFGSERAVMKDGVEDKNASRRTEFRLFNCGAQKR